ncbi:MAG: YncE family protein [Parachlamydiales bacterium]|nr:YncE family protein [Parachlamydiales bacterium]
MRLIFLLLCIGTLSASPFIWVANFGNSTVSVIDGATNQLVTTISQSQGMFNEPYPFAFTPDGKYAYFANYGATPASVSVIDTTNYQLVSVINLGRFGFEPYAAAASPKGDIVLIANLGTGIISVIDTATQSLLRSIISPNISAPSGIAFSKDGSFAYVSNSGTGSIAVIDTATFNVSIPPAFNGAVPAAFVITTAPNGEFAYVGNFSSSPIVVLDLLNNTISGSISLPSGTHTAGIVFSPDGSKAYVADSNHSAIDVINTSDHSVTVIDMAAGMFLNPNFLTFASNQKLYVANVSGNSVSVISTGSNALVDYIPAAEGNFNEPIYIIAQPGPAGGERAFERPSNRRPR